MVELAQYEGPQACPPGSIPAWPIYDADEEQSLIRTLQSRKWWRIPGAEVDAFEQAFARFLEVPHALAVTNGTQAIELALACLGIGFGDEVIVPAFTFASTITAVLHAGAVPVTVDVDLETYCMRPADVAAAITPRTKAVIPVHLAGQPCEMDGIEALARAHGLVVLSDAAHAHGARYRNESLARLCDAAIYSFQSGKLLTAGEGGAVVTRDENMAKLAWLKNSCGRPRTDKAYDHSVLGTNMRMGEFQGAILGAQLRRFPAQLAEREDGARRLDDAFSAPAFKGLAVQRRTEGVTTHSHYMYMVLVDEAVIGISRDELVDALVAEGVPAFRSYKCLPDLPMFRASSLWAGQPPASLRPDAVRAALERHAVPNARRLGTDSLWLHHPVLLGGAAVQTAVARAFAKVLGAADTIVARRQRAEAAA
jgi:3-amino-5-hydroxybenzoate synthase